MYNSGETKVPLPPLRRGKRRKSSTAARPRDTSSGDQTVQAWYLSTRERARGASRTANLVLLRALDVMAQGIDPAHTNWSLCVLSAACLCAAWPPGGSTRVDAESCKPAFLPGADGTKLGKLCPVARFWHVSCARRGEGEEKGIFAGISPLPSLFSSLLLLHISG